MSTVEGRNSRHSTASQYKPTNHPPLQRKIKLVTEQHKIDKPSHVEGCPMREWSIKLFMLDAAGNEHPAECFNKVVYSLHPSFADPVQTFYKPPFECKNEGWGEFELTVDCYYTEKTKISVPHDLNFQQEHYEVVQSITFKNPSQVLQEKLRELGPLPNDDERPKKKAGAAGKKTSAAKIDYEKIAQALEKLEEEDLLKAIQIIHDFKSTDTYIKSDVETGEFSIDLYTMPDVLTKNLSDYLATKSLLV
ncbi:hypothetical protein TD95_004275 [Thielaviopsis punctulata]|uniref:YEATS domain-containing protein n=1 Tax=Thielaviopsis punctulata TaxID=72032 RepID=A0A0F4ZBH8_9PEZI|nr:hypothetical protein TD95_004275 [Thielaviopsis punctulata]